MTALQDRLRAFPDNVLGGASLCNEAADALDALEAERDNLRMTIAVDREVREDLKAERDVLRERVVQLECSRDHWRQAYQDALAGGDILKSDRDQWKARAEAAEAKVYAIRNQVVWKEQPHTLTADERDALNSALRASMTVVDEGDKP